MRKKIGTKFNEYRKYFSKKTSFQLIYKLNFLLLRF